MAARLLRSFCPVLIALSAAGAVHAQSMTTNSASYNAGWGRIAGQENRGVDPSTRDANGNRLIVNGIIQSGSTQALFAGGASSAYAGAGASASASSDAGFSSATAIGNSLTVITQGDNNTVIIDSVQTNNGAVTAVTAKAGG